MRLVFVLIFAFCCSLTSWGVRQDGPSRELSRWLDRWMHARACLVAPAVDTATGAAIAMLRGHDCAPQLDELALPWGGASDEWQQAVALVGAPELRGPLPSRRAIVVERLDRAAASLSAGLVQPPPPTSPLPELEGGDQVNVPRAAASFNGGRLVARSGELLMLKDGDAPVTWFDSMTAPLDPKADRRAIPAPAPADPWIWLGPARGSAYHVDVGRWYADAPRGSELIDRWQDPRTRELDLVVRNGRALEHHRITTQVPHLRVAKLGPASFEWDDFHGTCHHGGVSWDFDGIAVREVGARLRRMLPVDIAAEVELDCRANSVLVLARWPDRLERCIDQCRRVFSPPFARVVDHVTGASAMRDDGRWIYAASLEGVAMVWQENAPEPAVYRLPEAFDLIAITVLAGRPYLVAVSPGSIAAITRSLQMRLFALPR